MKSTLNKIISAFLAAVMIISVIPFSVSAIENDPDVINTSHAEIKQTNSLSKILAEATDMSQVAMDSPYYISEMTFNDNAATVRYYNSEDCRLIVAVYDEETEQMLDSAVTLVEAESVTAELELTNDLPYHFLAKAFLIDENNASLCKELVCRTYTTEFEEMSELTTEDFDEEKVVNFDDNDENNFIVLSDDVVMVSGTKTSNVLSSSDVSNNTYTLTDIDDSVRSLKAGDSFYLDNGDFENFLAVKVKSITVNGSTAVIVAEDSEAEELFDCIKIDSLASAGQADYSSETADEAVEYEGAVDYETEEAPIYTSSVDTDFVDFSLSHKFKIKEKEYKSSSGKVEGKFSGGVTFSAKIGFSATFSGDYKDISFTIDPSIKVGVQATGKIEVLKIKLGSLGCRPVPPVIIGIEPQFVVKVSGDLSVNCEFKFTLGLGYNSRDGFINKCQKPSLDVVLKAEVTLFIGFDLQPHVALLSKHVAKITLSGEIGAEAKAAMKNISPSSQHFCTLCIDGDLTGKGKIGVKLAFGEDTFLEKEYEATLVDLSWKLGNFYYSISHNQFGFGSCPYILHGFTVKVTDTNGAPIKDAIVKTDSDGDIGTTTDAKGEAALTAGCGKVKLTAEAYGYNKTIRTITVNEDTVKFYLKLNKTGEPSDGTGSNDSFFTGTEATGTIINFGSYPQSKVTDKNLIKKLDMQSKVWESYEYYSGSGSCDDGKMEPSDYMNYADFKYNGDKYRAVTFSTYRPYLTGFTSSAGNTYQDDNGYTVDNVYYFKYEPLRWRVLDAGEGLVMSENIIDSQAYNNFVIYGSGDKGTTYYGDEGMTRYASDYANSSIRDWLNEDFYNTAFSDTQQGRIQPSHLENKSHLSSGTYDSADTDDNIFLLSMWDVLNTSYGFSSLYSTYDVNRRAHSTDYAKCQGCCTYKNSSYQTASGEDTSYWWLRSPDNSDGAGDVSCNGYAFFNVGSTVDSTYEGVRPALRLAKSSNPISPAPGKKAPAKAAVGAEVKTMYTSCGACAAGADYILLNVTGYGEGFTLTSENLLYIDQLTADSSGSLEIKFTPKYNDPDSATLLIGDFGSGVETKILTVSEVKKYSITWIIDGVQTVEYLAKGDPIYAPIAPEKEGYTFKGWTPSVPKSMPGADMTFTAVYEKDPEPQGSVKGVKLDDISLNYLGKATLKPQITADPGVRYTVKYESSNPKVATVDDNGNVYGAKKGTAEIRVTVTDENNNTVTDTCKVTVKYSGLQWFIIIVLFGWIWYLK